MLPFPDFSREFILYSDASNFSIGYILGQKDSEGRERVVSYAGRSLHPAEKVWDITDKECLAVIEGIKHFHVYLTGRHFQVYTDHSALKWLQSWKADNGRLGRWSLLLQDYDYDVVHIPGKKHGNDDCLSRITYNQHTTGIPSAPSTPEPAIPDSALDLMSIDYVASSETPHLHEWTEYHLTYVNKNQHVPLNINTISGTNTLEMLHEAEQNFISENAAKLLSTVSAVEPVTIEGVSTTRFRVQAIH